MPISSIPNTDGAPQPGMCGLCGGRDFCDGIGMVRYNVPIGDAHFGKLFRCPHYPVAQDAARQERLRQLSNLGAYVEKTFDNFITDSAMFTPHERESLSRAFNEAVRFAQEPVGWLLLEGTYGCGKTHLAAAVANARLQQGEPVLFITTPDLLDHLRAAFAPNADQSYDETFERIRGVPLLLLDDLGVENPSPWALEKLFQLLNHRYNHNLPTIITTNTTIDKLDPRIRSRLLDNAHTHRVLITATDYRTQRQNERTQLASSLAAYSAMTFDTFDTQRNATPDEATQLDKAKRAAQSYAQQPGDYWLLLLGGYGTGKTHLAAAIAHHRRQLTPHPDDTLFISAPELLDDLRTTFAPDAPVSFGQRLLQIKNVPLLVLDDLGTEGSSSWAKEKLFQIIDYRYVTRKATVITLSRSLDKLDERLLTRLLDKRICSHLELVVRSYVMRQR
ncbi:MAG: ATP-binding protein, partial [Armatimonadetes bacterium]|nr:ATP-binding protein [Anaerolineae bacterium]